MRFKYYSSQKKKGYIRSRGRRTNHQVALVAKGREALTPLKSSATSAIGKKQGKTTSRPQLPSLYCCLFFTGLVQVKKRNCILKKRMKKKQQKCANERKKHTNGQKERGKKRTLVLWRKHQATSPFSLFCSKNGLLSAQLTPHLLSRKQTNNFHFPFPDTHALPAKERERRAQQPPYFGHGARRARDAS